MKTIDFLPNKYRESYAARNAVLRRWTIVIGIALIITPLALYQYLAHRYVVHAVVANEADYVEAQTRTEQLNDLRKELESLRHEASLLAYLRHPWPRTQILARIHEPLPASMRLTGVKLASEPKPAAGETNPAAGRNRNTSRRAPDPRESNISETLPRPVRDLTRLVEQTTQNDSIVTLTGVTVDMAALHTYVARLRASGMFAKSELRSLESIPGKDESQAQRFEIRLVLVPGHGHPAASKSATGTSQSTAAAQSATPLASRP